jgi:peptide/nickel transport system substrate-binding protein
MFPVHTLVVGYLLFNERDPSDTARPHPILGDLQVRRALSMALDRGRVAQTVFGSNTEVPPAPVSRMLWVHALGVAPLPWDTAAARALLAKQGWSDHDGDGVLDKDGKPLALSMLLPTSSLPRKTMALQAQEQLRRLGIRLDLEAIEGGSILDRLAAGRFDLFFGSATQDPSPRGLVQSWSCAGRGGTNYARYCNPRVDTLIDRASVAQGTGADIWRAVIEQIRDDAPAIFLYAPDYIFVIHRRFENVSLRTESSWLDLWKWSVKPGAQIDRDRQ